jgi:ABC-type multidrug transport system permease subunit
VRRASLLLRKDLRVLRRSPLLLGILVAYPLLIAALVGLVAGYASAKPRVALVDEDGLPPTVTIAGHTFHVDRTIDQVSRNVKLVRLSPDDAQRQLENGKVVAVVTVPPGFVARLRTLTQSPTLELQTTHGGLAPRVEQQVQALVYSLNRQLQQAYIDQNLGYVTLILHGGNGRFLGNDFDLLGLDRAGQVLGQLPPNPKVYALQNFIRQARLALSNTGAALKATAHPIVLAQAPAHGRSWLLSAQVQAYGIALTISFLALLLAAGAVAAERDENVIGRLTRGLAGPGEIVGAKVALAATVAVALGVAIALLFGIAVEIGHVTGGEPWSRLPLVAVGLLAAGAALGAVGTLVGVLARDARSASLVALLVVLPIVFLGLVPPEVVPAAGWASDAFPFVHAVRFFGSALYDASPWRVVLREAAWLLGLAAVFGVAARASMRRLVT